ncbi:hypothetical protein J4402_05515 [Candidatus Pacearchaeota archaeon]|nr:hypothetical protein [Candidatus Pacearchaeota archaeon]
MNEKIMFVEDDEILLEYTTRCLERKGYSILPYSDGPTAINDIKEGIRYDLLLVDENLDGSDSIIPNLKSPNQLVLQISGRDIINLSLKVNPEAPIISLSGYNVIPKGVRNSLVKPFTLEELLQVIGNVIQ